MTAQKTIGLIFIPGVADWEFGLLAASAVEWFGARTVALTPGGKPVRSIAGFELAGERGLEPEVNADLDALAIIGSENWANDTAPDPSPLLDAVAGRGGVVGGICAGTLALARAGLFANRRHTSNGRDWISGHLPSYAGAETYIDVPRAVVDETIVSAPGSAPGTFAAGFLAALYPDQAETIAQMRRIFAAEYQAS